MINQKGKTWLPEKSSEWLLWGEEGEGCGQKGTYESRPELLQHVFSFST